MIGLAEFCNKEVVVPAVSEYPQTPVAYCSSGVFRGYLGGHNVRGRLPGGLESNTSAREGRIMKGIA